MSKTQIYLVRHCESKGNVSNRFMGHTNVDVTDSGLIQLEYLAERFKDIHLDKIYCSPLKRTVLTANAINKYHGFDLIRDERFIEINLGDFENTPMPQIIDTDPVNAHNWVHAPHLFDPPHGESMQSVYNRAFPSLADLAKENPGKVLAVASHGCFVRNALCRASGLPLSEINNLRWSNNTAVSLLEFDSNGSCEIIFMNDLSHLPQEVIDKMVYLPKIQRAEFEE